VGVIRRVEKAFARETGSLEDMAGKAELCSSLPLSRWLIGGDACLLARPRARLACVESFRAAHSQSQSRTTPRDH
jgi:hypothetical protein